MSSSEIWMLVAIFAILIVLAFLAVAETSLNRISRVKAQAISDSRGTKSARALLRLVTHPERFINPLLVTVTVLQMGQAFLTTLLADELFGAKGVAVGFVLNVIVFFVLTEAVPKTWAVLSAERAALLTARPTDWLVSFPPLRLVISPLSPGLEARIAQKGKKHTLTLATMPLIHPHAAGSDVGAEEHWVCVPADRDAQPVQTLSAFPWDVHRLADWFTTCRITTVVMASTGVDWIPLFHILAARGFAVALVHARHVTNGPGRPQTDRFDCRWLQTLQR